MTSEYTCDFPGCSASFKSKGHLNRHKAQHVSQHDSQFQCPACPRSFGRNDTLRRHMRQAHQEIDPNPPLRQACSACRTLKSRCDGEVGSSCARCLRRQLNCSLVYPETNIGRRNPLSFVSEQDIIANPQPGPNLTPSNKIQHFLNLYFELFDPHWSIIHRFSFYMNQQNESPLLVQSMVVIGLWVADGPGSGVRDAAVELHGKIDGAIVEQRGKWDASMAGLSNPNPDPRKWLLPMLQAILLHIIFALLHKGQNLSLGLDFKPSLSSNTSTALLESLVTTCRTLGMFTYRNIIQSARGTSDTNEDTYLPHVWVGIEEVKRFNIALYRVCRRFNFAGDGSGDWGLSAYELQFPPPANPRMWASRTWEDWGAAVADAQGITMDPDRRIKMDLEDLMEERWISKTAGVLEMLL